MLGGDGNLKSASVFIILLAKFFIYNWKMERKKYHYIYILNYLKARYEVERQFAYVNMSYGTFVTD